MLACLPNSSSPLMKDLKPFPPLSKYIIALSFSFNCLLRLAYVLPAVHFLTYRIRNDRLSEVSQK